MKLNALLLVLLLITSIKSNNALDPYSIEGFKDYLKENGLFEIIQTIKYLFGQDVAIICCEEFNPNYNGNCKKLVIEYMEEETKKDDEESITESIISSQSIEGSSNSQYDQPPENEIELSLNNGKKIKFSTILTMHDTLKKIFNTIELMSIYNRIGIRVIKHLSKYLKKGFFTFLKYLFGIRIKI